MKKRARGWMVWSGLVGGMLAYGALGVVVAQQPSMAANTIKEGKTIKTFTNKTTFFLPVKIDDRTRANLREVDLYIKIGHGDWVRQETGLPTQDQFTYRATQDGEYWFSLVTVDKIGKATPADLNAQPPNLKVIVDTRPPIIEVQPFTTPDGELFLRCQVKDANPDFQTLRITYRGTDQAERPLEPVPGQPGVFRISGPEMWLANLKASAVDRCGNIGIRDFSLREVVAGAGLPIPPLPGAQPPALPQTGSKTGSTSLVPAGFRPEPTAPPPLAEPHPNPQPMPSGLPGIPGTVISPVQPPAAPPMGLPSARHSEPAEPKSPSSVLPFGAGHNKQILNTTRATLEYRIDQVGPSGVGKVEIWITSDQGTTWTRLCEDSDRRSPAEINLPGEGLFGLRLVVTNGNGFGGTPPQRGDQPTSWLEVDSTPPHVQVQEIDPMVQAGMLELRWTVSDKNTTAEPVTLYYAARREGPWHLIARHVKNEGSYRWAFPREVGGQFFIRVEAVDMAGNVGRAETSAPIVLDMTEPRAQVISVTGITAQPSPVP